MTARPTPTSSGQQLADDLTALLVGRLPGQLGMRVIEASPERVVGELPVTEQVLAPNGYLHAATLVALADTVCGLGARLTLPEGAPGYTTLELKTNYLGTARSGSITAVGTPVHLGRSTQVWDATVTDDRGRPIALFRCTQLILASSSTP